MHPVVERLRIGLVFSMVLFAGSNVLVGRVFAAEPAPSARCVAAAYRQFDFWAGDWDVFDAGSSIPVAHARIDSTLDGCVLREDYQGADGHKGQSFTIYDAARKVWHQSWVTNRGELLEIEGKTENGEIILSGEDHAAGSLVRGTWKPQNGDVRETAVTSTDGGNTWKPWFDLVFRRKASAVGDTRTSADDIEAVAALDCKYQAAVKENDAATMETILADDFALVTGSGKVYTKADLLAEARSQDDTQQTLRIWGDTAVITALLTETGSDDGRPFDYDVWFSDTYVRTPSGWRYVFGQASSRSPRSR
jgi:hypothetical protein